MPLILVFFLFLLFSASLSENAFALSHYPSLIALFRNFTRGVLLRTVSSATHSKQRGANLFVALELVFTF
jgi:hypothetical protein